MPRDLVRAPNHDRARSLGWLGTAWMEFMVRHGPGNIQGEPVRHGDEFTGFIVDCYAVDENGRMLYDSGFFSRPKGADKSGLGARLALFEAFGPCRFAGRFAKGGEVYRDPWGLGFEYTYEPGEPMGKPILAPFIRVMATEVGQTGNVFRTIYYNLTDSDCPLSYVPGKDAGLERVLLPGGGEIRVSTASAASKDGGLETFVVFDESHIYNSPELREMYAVTTRNLRKRKKMIDTWSLETTTMFAPGEDSIAEKTYAEAEALQTGRKKRGRHRLLYDHRWGQCDDLKREDMLREAIAEAFGEAVHWNDVDAIVDEFYDSRTDPNSARRYFLNAQTSASDAWIAAHEWNACKRPDLALRDGDLVCLGLDGAISEDSTALCAVRVQDGHLELLGVWEKPIGPEGEGWQVDREAVDAAVATAMHRFEVCGFYADPPHWADYIDRWNAKWGADMRVRATQARPLEWWTNRPRAIIAALERFHEAVLERRLSFTPPEDRTDDEAQRARVLRTHVLQAKRRQRPGGIMIGKDFHHSPKKIDAAVAAVLAWECRNDAVALGVESMADVTYAARRLR